MTRKPHPSRAKREPQAKPGVLRIRVNGQGYDKQGAYWGRGHDVFIVTIGDDAEEITVRARNKAEALQKAAAERARAPAEPPAAPREPIGGAAPYKRRFEIDWQDPATATTVRIRITHARDYLSTGSDHIEIESIKPKRAPLPITDTGYRSHFMPAADLLDAGGPVAFVTAWIAEEAKGKSWTRSATAAAQGNLFQWAAANAEVAAKRAGPRRPKAAAAPAARRRLERRDPE